MAQTSINIRMDEDLKRQFDACCKEMGMSMTTAFSIFAKTVVRKQAIPFEVRAVDDPFYSAENLAELESRVASVRNGTSTLKEHELIEADDDEESVA